MRQALARDHLLVVAELFEQHDAWLCPTQVEIDINADLTGTVTSNWALAADKVQTVSDAYPDVTGETKRLPVPFAAAASSVEGALEVTLELATGRERLAPVPMKNLLDAAGGSTALRPELRETSFLQIGADHLGEAVGLRVSSPTEEMAKRANGGRGRARVQGIWRWSRHMPHPLKALSPIGLITVEAERGFTPEKVRISLPSEMRADRVALRLDTGIEPALHELVGLLEFFDSKEGTEVDVLIAEQQAGHAEQYVKYAIRQLRNRAACLEPIKGGDGKRAYKRLEGCIVELSKQLGPLVQVGGSESTRMDDLANIVRPAVEVLSDIQRVQVGCKLRSTGRLVVPDALRDFEVREVSIAYSADARAVLAQRPGTRFSLITIVVLLTLIGWRLAPGFDLHPTLTGAHLRDFSESREAIVAILLVGPALLYTQVDRIQQGKHAADRSIGVLLAFTRIAVFAPYVVAVLSLGAADPELVVGACFVAALLVLGSVVALSIVMGDPSLRLGRHVVCRREVSRG